LPDSLGQLSLPSLQDK